ncbi:MULTISPECIES: hypothetical protein [Methylosinus]|uniref:Energy transducer TonB n=1 Tax=Methylosinus trichosporium (strain ATCC 35070 / NCIMB 11131 / UNIQEM 75 / OB3b) TaxID=595536 RepID=A0A2D2D390_METT3|nr:MULTISPECIES: hypothetical protein [Methylosinus]ATQ69329.1 hypothetical protein CQW49_16650 [Methylosinus trichosporium OB3b]OBS52514.1 hypothetical protein A8B73_10735 [Methylosinus sp. 3S-1]
MFKTLFIAAILAASAQPAVAQSIFEGFGEPEDPAAAELYQWKRAIYQQIKEHAPRLNLGRGRADVSFCVDSAGRVVKGKVDDSSSDAHDLIAASVISSLKLPPAPPTVRKTLGRCCLSLQGRFRFY